MIKKSSKAGFFMKNSKVVKPQILMNSGCRITAATKETIAKNHNAVLHD